MAPTDDVVARGADVPLALSTPGPRDALLDPREGDIIPDLETKGLHVGEVAQPAEPVLHRGGDVTFESLPEAPESRFKPQSFADQKKANSEMQANDPAYAGRLFVGDGGTEETVAYETRTADSGEGQTKADLRARLTELGVADADQPGSRASHADLSAAVAAAESGGGESATEKLDRESAAVAKAQAADDRSDK